MAWIAPLLHMKENGRWHELQSVATNGLRVKGAIDCGVRVAVAWKIPLRTHSHWLPIISRNEERQLFESCCDEKREKFVLL